MRLPFAVVVIVVALGACQANDSTSFHVPVATRSDAGLADADAAAPPHAQSQTSPPNAAVSNSAHAQNARVYAKTTPIGTRQSDLLSPPCEPGTTCEARVVLPSGMRLIGKVVLDDGHPGTPSQFMIDSVTENPVDHDETELVVVATNRGNTAARLRGIFQYGPSVGPHAIVAHPAPSAK